MKNLIFGSLIVLSSIISNASNPEPRIERGLIIDKVEIGSPYDKVGLKKGDEVLSFDRTPLKSPKDAMNFYNSAKQGKIKVMLVVRNGVGQNIHVPKSKTWDLNQVIQNANPKETSDLTKVLADIDLEPIKDPISGNQVTRVKRVAKGSIYAKLGIKPGDLVNTGSSNGPLKLEETHKEFSKQNNNGH